MPKKPSKKTLKKKADEAFGRYIKLRDCLETTGDPNRCVCITCGETKPCTIPDSYENQIDPGHFRGRARDTTRYNEENVNGQCKYCNRFKDGEQYLHGLAIDKKYGKGTADRLTILSNQTARFTESDLQEIIETYQQKTKELI